MNQRSEKPRSIEDLNKELLELRKRTPKKPKAEKPKIKIPEPQVIAVPTAEELEEIDRRQKEAEKRRADARRASRSSMVNRSIPPRYKAARASDFPKLKIPDLNSLDSGIFLPGENGVGKTHLAAALSMHYAQETETFIWENVNDLLAEIRRTFKSGSDTSETEIIQELGKVDLLVLDDLGAEKTSDWTLQTLYAILNRRHDYVRPTIVTTNMKLSQIHEAEPRIASRLAGYDRIKLTGEDRRLKK